MNAKPAYDPTTLSALRRTLDAVLLDTRFVRSRSVSALEIAEHILAQAALGERDVKQLKASALEKIRLAGAKTGPLDLVGPTA